MTFGLIYNGEEQIVGISEEIRRDLLKNTWVIHDINAMNLREISRNNTGNISEKSQNISRNNTGIMPENVGKNPDKLPEKPSKLVVKKPKNSDNYDANTLEYCCKILEHLVVSDGASIKLTNLGLVLKSNPTYPVFQLKYCPNCGTKIEQDTPDYVEKSIPEPKEILRDNMANKPPS